jgi:putative sterol carrier protein
MTVRDYFTARLGRSYDPRLAEKSGSIRFEVDGAGSWILSVDHGQIQLEEGHKPTDCLIRTDEATQLKIINGEENVLTSLLQGRVQVEGKKQIGGIALNFFGGTI